MKQIIFDIVSGPTWIDIEASWTHSLAINIFVREQPSNMAAPYSTHITTIPSRTVENTFFKGETQHPVYGLISIEAVLKNAIPHRGTITFFVHEGEEND